MSTPDTSDTESLRIRVHVPRGSLVYQALRNTPSARTKLLALAELGAIHRGTSEQPAPATSPPSPSPDVTAAILSIANSLQGIHQVLGQWAHAPNAAPGAPTKPAGSVTTPVTAAAAREGGLLAAPVSTLLELENYGQ